MCHLNIRSIRHPNNRHINTKFELIREELVPYFNIITVSETWLDDSDCLNDYFIEGGGVMCYVSDTLPAKRRQDLEFQQMEVLWLEVFSKNQKLVLGVIYRPPKAEDIFWEQLQNSIDTVNRE